MAPFSYAGNNRWKVNKQTNEREIPWYALGSSGEVKGKCKWIYIYILSSEEGALACAGVVRAAILVDASVAHPRGFDAGRAGSVPGTVVVGEISAHKILVGLRRAHLPKEN